MTLRGGGAARPAQAREEEARGRRTNAQLRALPKTKYAR